MANENKNIEIENKNDFKKLKVYKKISKIQMKMQIEKSERNQYSNFNYRNIENLLVVLKPILLENEIMIRFKDTLIKTNDKGDDFILCTIELIDFEHEYIEEQCHTLKIDYAKKMDFAQCGLSAESFAKKRLIDNIFLTTDPEDDPDGNDNRKQHNKQQNSGGGGDNKKKLTQEQINSIWQNMNGIYETKEARGEAAKNIIKKYNCGKLEFLSIENFNEVIKQLQTAKKKKDEKKKQQNK